MNKFYASFLALSILFFQSGCATIVGGGGSQRVEIQSEPSGAELFVDGVNSGKTPVSVALDKRDTHQLKFKKDGYSEEVMLTRKKMNPWIWGNLILGGIIGILVDVSTGAANKIEPDNYYVIMTKVKPAQDQAVVVKAETQAEPEVKPQLQEKIPSQVVKLSSQSEAQSPAQPISDSIVQAGQKADLSAAGGAATTSASQDNAQPSVKTSTQAPPAPISAQK